MTRACHVQILYTRSSVHNRVYETLRYLPCEECPPHPCRSPLYHLSRIRFVFSESSQFSRMTVLARSAARMGARMATSTPVLASPSRFAASRFAASTSQFAAQQGSLLATSRFNRRDALGDVDDPQGTKMPAGYDDNPQKPGLPLVRLRGHRHCYLLHPEYVRLLEANPGVFDTFSAPVRVISGVLWICAWRGVLRFYRSAKKCQEGVSANDFSLFRWYPTFSEKPSAFRPWCRGVRMKGVSAPPERRVAKQRVFCFANSRRKSQSGKGIISCLLPPISEERNVSAPNFSSVARNRKTLGD